MKIFTEVLPRKMDGDECHTCQQCLREGTPLEFIQFEHERCHEFIHFRKMTKSMLGYNAKEVNHFEACPYCGE